MFVYPSKGGSLIALFYLALFDIAKIVFSLDKAWQNVIHSECSVVTYQRWE